MRALRRAAAADLRHRRLQSLLLLVVVAVATLGITAGLGQQRSAAERWDAAFAEANGAHVAFYGDARALRGIAADREVVQSAGPSPVAWATLARGRDTIDDVELRAAGARRAAVGVPLLFDGRWLSGRDPSELVVGRSFAVAEGIEPGDRVRLQGEAASVDARVVGTALDLVDCFYPECGSQMAWTSPQTVARLAPGSQARSILLVRIARPQSVEAFIGRVADAAGPGVEDLEFFEDTRSNALALNKFFGAFLATFGVFLMVAAGIVILSTVSARVLARYRELGILKAVGFTPRSLTLLLLGENLAIAVVGAALGVVAGGLLAPSLQIRMAEVLERGSATFPAGVMVGAFAIVLAIVAAATLLPAVRAGRVPASRAIAHGAAPVSTRPSRLARLATRARLGPAVAVGLKDAGARPLRSWLTVAALSVTVVAIVAALAFDSTVGAIADDPALGGDPQGVVVDRGDAAPAAVRQALARQPGVASWFTETERQATAADQSFQLSAIGGDVAKSGYVIRDGRMLSGPGEAVIGYGLKKALGVDVGDRVALAIGDGRLDVRVVGRYAVAEDDGERALISLAALRRIEPGADAGAYLVKLAPGADRAAVARSLQAAVPGIEATAEEVDTSDFDAFRAAFYLIAALVLAVGLANLTATTVLGVHERLRDLAVLKTIGFTPRQVGISVAAGAAALATAAVAIGVPVGLLAAAAMFSGIGSSIGIGPELGATPALGALVTSVAGVIALASGLGALAARRAARAPVAEVLRAE